MTAATDFTQVGSRYGNFFLEKVDPISELQCTLYQIVHTLTGARILHIANSDPENVFCLSFRTCPDSSDGVAHILEHTVLCGSKKYPVKDPFFSMLRRSLNTFMNAFTGSDFTCYPAASQIPADFYNLLEIYLDAVFYPLLNEKSFLQEGHRLEFSDPNNTESALEYKGIVFNEMKGALLSGEERLSQSILELIFPDLTYTHNSGGDPKIIPQLTYQQLKEFHQKYYYPSRCLFYFYGNMPITEHLDFIESKVLSHTSFMPPLLQMPIQRRFTEPKKETRSYPSTPEQSLQHQGLVGIAWLGCPIQQQIEVLALEILDNALMGTDASPLKRSLLNSGLCTQVDLHFEQELTEVLLVLYFKGCDVEKTEQLQQVVQQALEQIATEGVSAELIEAALHQIEFSRCEITGDSHPFGLSLFFRAGLLSQQGGDPIDGLRIHSLFTQLRQQIQDPRYFSRLIQKYFLHNTHSVCVTMQPDAQLLSKENAAEQQVLEQIRQQLTDSQKQKLVSQAHILQQFQQEQELDDHDILPCITLDDIPASVRDFELKKEQHNGLTIFHHETFTNQIIYVDLTFPLPQLSWQELPWARLVTFLLTEVGAGSRNYQDNLHYMQAHTGGISACLNFSCHASDFNVITPKIFLSGKALQRNVDKLFTLLRDTIAAPDFTDRARLKELVVQHLTDLQQGLSTKAMRHAINLAGSTMSFYGSIAQKLYGLNYFYFVRDLVLTWDDQVFGILNKLNDYCALFFQQNEADLVLSCNRSSYQQLQKQDFFGLASALQQTQTMPWSNPPFEAKQQFIAAAIASPVSFNAMQLPGIFYTHPDAAAISIATQIMEHEFLHPLIREQGGAYGSSAVNQPGAGRFYLSSYRDPNIASTIAAFHQAIIAVSEGDFDAQHLREAKFSLIQQMDSPVSPGSRAAVSYNWLLEGRTKEVRQNHRDQLLAATEQDVQRALQNNIAKKLHLASYACFAGQELLSAESLKICAQHNLQMEIITI